MFSLSSLVAVAAVLNAVNANFIVLTNAPPEPSLPADWTFGQIDAWKSSILKEASSLALEFQDKIATDTSFLSLASIVDKKSSQFFATATYSFEGDVTATDDSELITTVPPWYSALPTEMKQYNDIEASALSSIQSQAYKNVKIEDITADSSSETESTSAARSSASRTTAPSTLATETTSSDATSSDTPSRTSLSNPALTSAPSSSSDASATSATISSASPSPTGAAGRYELEGTLMFGMIGAAVLNFL